MHGGAPVKRNRIANKRTHKVRHPSNRPAYYMLKQPTIIKYKKYFKNILPKLTPKSTVTLRKSTRAKRERKIFDPNNYNTRKNMNNRGTKSKGSATAVAHNRMSAAAVAKERLAIVNRARALYGVSDATKKVRAAFIRSYIRAKQLGATPSQAEFAAENEIAAIMAESTAATPAAAAPAAAAPAAAAAAFVNNNNNDDDGANNSDDNIEEMLAGLTI